jgi:hypothetical protein
MSGNINREVYLAGNEITNWVTLLPETPQLMPEWGEIPSLPRLNIQVRSDDFAFHPTHPVSLLYQKKLADMTLQVKRWNNVVWSGVLEDFTADYNRKSTTLIGQSLLSQAFNRSARIDTDDLLPSQAIANILTLHGIEYDNESFARADAILDDIPLRIRVRPDVLDWQGTLGELLKLICVAGLGRLYLTRNGAIGFDSFSPVTTTVQSFSIDDNDIMEQPVVENDEADIFDGYSIKWLHSDSPEESGSGTNIQSLDFSESSAVHVTTQAGAIYIGTQWIELSKESYYRLVINLKKDFALIAKIGAVIGIESDYLQISGIGEIIGIDDGDNRFTKYIIRVRK